MNGENYTLFAHQREAVERAVHHDSFALFMETGTGKTLVAIELAKDLVERYRGEELYALVVCPLSIIESVWISEFAKFAPKLTTCNLWKHRKDTPETLPEANVYVINYESVDKIPTWLLKKFKLVILDESTKIKNFKAGITKFFLRNKKLWKHRLVMTGTPAPNNLLEYWSQMAFINPKILGENYYRFRAINFYQTGFGGYLWKPSADLQQNIGRMLSKQAYVVKKKDCLDLPPQTFESRKYTMPPRLRKCYDQMLKANITEVRGRPVLGANEMAKIMKLRQLTAGFVVDATGKTISFNDGKLRLLKETLEEIGDHQVIVWVQFHAEIKQIKDAFPDCRVLAGTENASDKEQTIKDFQAGKIRLLVAHPRSAGHGLNFSNCSYAIYFSLSYSFEEEKQSQDRIHRIGQTKKTTYLYLLADKSIDEVIYKALRKKERFSDAILKMVQEDA